MNHEELIQELNSKLNSLKIARTDAEFSAQIASERLAMIRNQIEAIQNRLSSVRQGQLELDIRPPMALA